MQTRGLRYVRADEMWSRTGTMSASSSQDRYGAERAQKDDPAWGWWSDDTAGDLTVTLGGDAEIGVAAVIHTNADDAIDIDVTGAIAGTITASRGVGGWPRNLALIPDTPVVGSSVTISTSGNAAKWYVGQFVVGKLREFWLPYMRGASRLRRRSVLTDTDELYDHDIRIDLGSQKWAAAGRLFADDPALQELIDLWEASAGGAYPTLVIPNEVDTEPRFCRVDVVFQHTNDGKGQHYCDFTFSEIGRGIVVV